MTTYGHNLDRQINEESDDGQQILSRMENWYGAKTIGALKILIREQQETNRLLADIARNVASMSGWER